MSSLPARHGCWVDPEGNHNVVAAVMRTDRWNGCRIIYINWVDLSGERLENIIEPSQDKEEAAWW